MHSTFERTETCLFCGKPRNWRSVIAVRDDETGLIMFIVTVCPDCRKKHSIHDIYEKVIEIVNAELQKVLKKE